MKPKAFWNHLIVLCFLVMSLAGLCFALLRVRLPFVPAPVTAYSYQMMAPYQQYDLWHQDFYAWGQRSGGSWVEIDLAPYMPYPRSQRYVRSFLRSYTMIGRTDTGAIVADLAQQILDHEQAAGRSYEALEFGAERWPISTAGYEALRSVERESVWSAHIP